MDVTEGLTGEVTRNGSARTLQSRAKEKRLMENQRGRAGRKEVERFVGQLREFGGNGRSNRRVRRTGRLVLSAAFLGVALLLLTACGGDTGSGDTGSTAAGEQYDSTREESTSPISPVCQPPDMEGCYGYEDMQAYADQIIPMVEAFFDDTYADMPHPNGYIYIAEGEVATSSCGDITTDGGAYLYCTGDNKIYLGQPELWMYYSEDGDAAPAVGLAHEWGHHVQNVVGVPQATSNAEQVVLENQADCIAGAWIAYADEKGWLDYPDDLNDTDALLKDIASTEPNRDHGDLGERTESMLLGIEDGLQGCNDFYPIIEEATTPSAPSAA